MSHKIKSFLYLLIFITLFIISCQQGSSLISKKQDELSIAVVYDAPPVRKEIISKISQINDQGARLEILPFLDSDSALESLKDGSADLIILRSDELFQYYYGLSGSNGNKELRILGPVGLSVFYPQISSPDIRNFSDLAGNKINTGPPRSDLRKVSRMILKTFGLTPGENYIEEGLSLADARRTVLWGSVSAVFTYGDPLADLRGLSLSEEEQQKLLSRYPYYSIVYWPTLNNPYPAERNEIYAAALPYFLCGTKKTDPEAMETFMDLFLKTDEIRYPIPLLPSSENHFFYRRTLRAEKKNSIFILE